ncbi:2TM domain-containing protein [Amycolatopsis sp. GM8]|uniref:2TM domain-containing protein n=1 Tax=Amycolatopsis sp. GM8 TaxID=2896530 RepID=UPI001F196162|nr:2TM domain-containing protein [Amycolatopsis sp. GM8]
MTEQGTPDEPDRRAEAIARLKKKREFFQHLLVYVLMNGLIVVIWWLVADGGFFWPVFPIGFWGIGLVMHGWDTFAPGRVTERRIRREMDRLP